jgi:hypothetical protein
MDIKQLLTLLAVIPTLAYSANNSCEYPPQGWSQLVACDNRMLYNSRNVIQHFNSHSPNLVVRFNTWIRRPDNTYVEIEVGCLSHKMFVYEDGRQINETTLNPGSPFWNMRDFGCTK